MKSDLTRREFIAATTVAAASALVPGQSQPASAKGPWVCVFSKHLPFLDCAALAKTCKDLGLDGVDLTVRKGGHVVPEKVGVDLPRAVELFRAEGLDVRMISTNLFSGDDPDARPILEAAAKAGISYCRIGPQLYGDTGSIRDQLKKATEEVRSLVKIADEFKITLGYHNHSGRNNVGAAIWDLEEMIEAIGSDRLGSNFDIGHAAVEGAYGVWETNARLIAPHIKMVSVKDFVWDKDKPKWVPLGEGIVKTALFFKIVRAAGFAGPISLHFEYKIASNDVLLKDIRKAAVTLQGALAEAGYA